MVVGSLLGVVWGHFSVLGGHFLFGAPPAMWIPFLQTASSRTFGRYVFSHSKHTMAEEIQPTKKHKNNTISTLTDIQECELIGVHLPTPLVNSQPEEAEPIGAQLSTQSAIPIGEEAKLDATHSSESFLDSDARKTIDDNLNLVTRDLPKFSSLHNVTSVAIMGTVDAIQIPLIRARAYQHIRKALTEAFPLLEASAIKLATDIAQTKLASVHG